MYRISRFEGPGMEGSPQSYPQKMWIRTKAVEFPTPSPYKLKQVLK
jgi:hypothetical protein